MKHLTTCLLVLALGACGGTESAAAPIPDPSAPPSAPSPAAEKAPAPPPAAQPAAMPIESVAACPFTAAAVSEALGAKYGDGKELPAIPGVPVKACSYEANGASTLRVNVSVLTPAMAEAVKADLSKGFAGERTKLEGDPDGAVFQMQSDMGTCALFYVRGTVQYEVRLMTCRGDAAQQKAKLTKLPRP